MVGVPNKGATMCRAGVGHYYCLSAKNRRISIYYNSTAAATRFLVGLCKTAVSLFFK
jgi:hypothetical protein